MIMLIMKERMMRKTVRMKKNKEICQLKNVAFDLGENPHSKYWFVFQIFYSLTSQLGTVDISSIGWMSGQVLA